LTSVFRIGYCNKPVPAMPMLLAQLGNGSTLVSGRWHTKGPMQMVYAGSSRAICQLEKRVHANGSNPKGQVLMRLDLPSGADLLDVRTLGLPSDWRTDEAATRSIGDKWLAGGSSLGLWVPSFVEPDELNLLINAQVPTYGSIVVDIERDPFVFDPRLLSGS
jgi:RES domain-containing protein